MTAIHVKTTAVRVIQTPFPKSIASFNVPEVPRRPRAIITRAKSTAKDTLATNAVMMVRMRVKIEKVCEARNRENPTERSDKPAVTGWRTRTASRAFSTMLTICGEIPTLLKST